MGSLGGQSLPAITIQSNGLADSQGQTSDISVVSWVATPGQAAIDDVQQVEVTAPAGGTFDLSFKGAATGNLAVGTTAAQLQTDLAALATIGAGNVAVTGSGTADSPYLVTFTAALGGIAVPALAVVGAGASNTIGTAYNADGQITSIGDNYSHYAYTYDGQGNTASVDNTGTPGVPDVFLTSQYDAAGNRKSLSATINGTADFLNSYNYDTLSRLDQIQQQGQSGGNAVAAKSVYFVLDAIGDVTEIDRSNSVFAGPNQSGAAYSLMSYNATTGLLSGINHEYMGASLDDLTYTYDTLDRVSTFGSIDGTATYGYDPTSQLTSATYTTNSGGHQPANESYNFDNNGNRTSVNGTQTTVASNNEVTNDGTFAYTFDAEGNRLTRTRDSSATANDYEVSYSWDTRNRLVEVQDFNNTGTLTEQINYAYDVYDHLIERVDDVIGGTTTTVHYVWDGDHIVLAFNGTGPLTTRYLNGPNTSAYDHYFSTLAEEDVTTPSLPGATTWDLLDNEGTLRDVTSANGVVVDHLNYNSQGQLAYESAPTVSHLDGYAGGLYDPSTQLVYFIHRWYDPAATVWISADPRGFTAGDTNLGRYVGNDPVGAIDPSGLILAAFDGTDNSPESHTNVWRFNNVYRGPKSYLPGVGTDQASPLAEAALTAAAGPIVGPNAVPVAGKAWGYGTAARIRRMLAYLEEQWKNGCTDKDVDIVGFSRGAAAARAFANALTKSGLLEKYGARIRFIGVFDTVPSIGVAHDSGGYELDLPESLDKNNAYHAVSLDEDRSKFGLERYEGSTEVFFGGAHADVGGGYPLDESGLSNAALRWMLFHAVQAGVPVNYTNSQFPICPGPGGNVVRHDQIKASWLMWLTNNRRSRGEFLPRDQIHISAGLLPYGPWMGRPDPDPEGFNRALRINVETTYPGMTINSDDAMGGAE